MHLVACHANWRLRVKDFSQEWVISVSYLRPQELRGLASAGHLEVLVWRVCVVLHLTVCSGSFSRDLYLVDLTHGIDLPKYLLNASSLKRYQSN